MSDDFLNLLLRGATGGAASSLAGGGKGGSTLSALLNSQDLNAYQEDALSNNFFAQAAPIVSGFKFNKQNWSPGQDFGISLAQSFLGGLMGNYGRSQVSDQVKKVARVLPSLYDNPLGVQAPEGLDSSAWNRLQSTAAVKKAQQEASIQNTMQELGMTALGAGLKKKAEIIGENSAYGFEGADNPNSPSYKSNKDKLDSLDSIRDKFNKLPEVQSYSLVNKAAQAMAGALKDKGGPSDLELVRYAVQMIEPGMAVREGEQQAVLQSGSIPDQWKGELSKSLKNGTAISDTVRDGLKRLASRSYDAQKSGYEKALTYHQGLVEGRKLLQPGESISYLGDAPSAEDIFGKNTPSLIPEGAKATGQFSKGKPVYNVNGRLWVPD
jgi:hypothetical protein